MDLNPEEVRVKHAMAGACERVIGIFDGDQVAPDARCSPSSRPSASTRSSRTPSAPAEDVEAWRARGTEVVIADADAVDGQGTPARDLLRSARGRGLMRTLAAVDLGAQSGRVALGRFDGARLARLARSPVRQRARAGAGTAAVGRAPSLRGRAGRPARRGPRGGHAGRGRRRLVGGRLRAARRARPPAAEPGPLPRRAPGGRGRRPCWPRSRRASSTSAPASSCMPINTVFELAAMAAEHDPVARRGGERSC